MKKLLSYILILVVLALTIIPVTIVTAYDTTTKGKCTIRAYPGGVEEDDWLDYTETQCHADTYPDKKDANAEFIKWTAYSVANCVKPLSRSSVDGSCVCELPWGVMKDNKCIDPNTTPTNPDMVYTFLAPLPELGKTFDASQPASLSVYLNIMMRVFIGVCAVLAVIMIVVGGIEYMTSELPESKGNGKNRIIGAIFGLVLALGAWTILNTINPDLLKVELTNLEDVTVVVNIEDSSPQTPNPSTGKYGNTGYKKGDVWDGTPTALPEGVSVNTGECARVGDSGCTSLKGLNMSAVLDIKSKCPSCSLTISGGTEFWLHGGQSGRTSHGKGSSTVDLKTNSALNTFLSGGKPLVKYKRYPSDGGPYYYEGNHWHVGP